MKSVLGMLLLVLLAGCQQRTPDSFAANAVAPAPQPATTQSAANESTNVALPNDRTSLPEPKGPIDPKSAEAAGQVVQHYGALIEQGRQAQAAKYWSDGDAASAFAKQLQARGLKHLEIGKPGEPEGAAGSIYVTMPVVFYDGDRRSAADVALRRVNNVPGSTEAQRRWHIERI